MHTHLHIGPCLLPNCINSLIGGPKGVRRKLLHISWEGRGEQKCLSLILVGELLQDLINRRPEAHVKQIIRLMREAGDVNKKAMHKANP